MEHQEYNTIKNWINPMIEEVKNEGLSEGESIGTITKTTDMLLEQTLKSRGVNVEEYKKLDKIHSNPLLAEDEKFRRQQDYDNEASLKEEVKEMLKNINWKTKVAKEEAEVKAEVEKMRTSGLEAFEQTN